MVNKQSKRAKREAARLARQRQQRILWGGMAASAVAIIGLLVLFGGGSDDQAAALAPDFELADSAGETVKLSDYRGQPVALTFMHTY